MAKKILFVCTGNTCRSSMAEALARELLARRQLAETVEVSSAGVAAWPGSPASPQAVEVLKEQGIDLTTHKAKIPESEELKGADLILTMTGAHRGILLARFPELAEKTYTLAGYIGEEQDIPDPFGGSVEVYRQCAGVLRDMLARALDKFLQEDRKG